MSESTQTLRWTGGKTFDDVRKELFRAGWNAAIDDANKNGITRRAHQDEYLERYLNDQLPTPEDDE